MGRKIRIIDATMRDGTHALGYEVEPDKMAEYAKVIQQAGIDTIEIGHGFGLGASSINYGRLTHSDDEYFKEVAKVMTTAKLDALVMPGIALLDDVDKAYENGARVFRVAVHCTLGDCAEQYIRYCKSLPGTEVFGFSMMSHMSDLDNIVLQSKRYEDYGADGVYVTDSAGAMLPNQVGEYIAAVKNAVSVPVGFHGHNNLGLAIGNSLAAADAGADCIDATLCGMGAASGNAQMEVLAGVLQKSGYETGLDLFKLMDAADQFRGMMKTPQHINNEAFIVGYAGTYGSFYYHSQEVGEKYGVDPRLILLELGRRGAVGGQDDMVIEIGLELAGLKN